MGRKLFITIFLVAAIAIATGYGYYLKKKSEVIEDIKENIKKSFELTDIEVKQIDIPSGKVSVSIWKLLSGGVMDISSKDLSIDLAANELNGKLTIKEINLKYPSSKDRPVELCKISDAKFTFDVPEITLSASIKNSLFTPCLKLEQKPHALSVTYSDLTVTARQNSDPMSIVVNMKCKSLNYSQRGHLENFPYSTDIPDFRTFTTTVKKWCTGGDMAGKKIWEVKTNLKDLAFFTKSKTEEISFSLPESSFGVSMDTSQKRELSLHIHYGLKNLKVNNKKLMISWQLLGISPSSIFPATVKADVTVNKIPVELLSASIIFMHGAVQNKSSQYASEILSSIMASLFKEKFPFKVEVNLHTSSGAEGKLTMKGSAGVMGTNGSGTITLTSADVLLNNLTDIARKSFEKTIANKLTCDPSYKNCSGQFILRNGKIDFIEKW